MQGVKPWQVVVIVIGLVAIIIVAWQAYRTFKPPVTPPGPGPMTGITGPGPMYTPPGPMPPAPR